MSIEAVVVNDKFFVKSFTGGEQDGFPAENILKLDDETVYCTEKGLGSSILLETKEDVVISEVVVRGPIRGFGEPVCEGVVQIGDLRENFEVDEFLEAVVSFDPPVAAKKVVVEFLETHGDGDNIDVTYIALISSPKTVPKCYIREVLHLLRPSLDPKSVLPLESILHHVGRTPIAIGIGEENRKKLTEATSKISFPGYAWAEPTSRTANLLRRQFKSPEGEYISVLHSTGQYVMGGDGGVVGFLEKCKEMIEPEPVTECCQQTGTTPETKPPTASEHPYLNSTAEVVSWVEPHPVALVVYMAPWCAASTRSLPLLSPHPTALINVDTFPDTVPDVTPVVAVYSKGVLVGQFDEITRQGAIDVQKLEEMLREVEKQ